MEADGCLGSPPGPDCPCPTAPKGPPHLWGRVHGAGFPSPAAASWLLGWHFLEEVRDPLHQEISVFQVGEEEGHFALGANGQRAGQDAGAVSFFDNGHLRSQVKRWASVSRDGKLTGVVHVGAQWPHAVLSWPGATPGPHRTRVLVYCMLSWDSEQVTSTGRPGFPRQPRRTLVRMMMQKASAQPSCRSIRPPQDVQLLSCSKARGAALPARCPKHWLPRHLPQVCPGPGPDLEACGQLHRCGGCRMGIEGMPLQSLRSRGGGQTTDMQGLA